MTTILYIEDNPDNMKLMRKTLVNNEYDFLGAENGLKGLEMAASNQPDLILLDINLPDIDGYEVARRLRENARGASRHVPIVAITANALEGDGANSLAAGCDVYMPKLINLSELLERVKALLADTVAS